jgi:hypothetical protein
MVTGRIVKTLVIQPTRARCYHAETGSTRAPNCRENRKSSVTLFRPMSRNASTYIPNQLSRVTMSWTVGMRFPVQVGIILFVTTRSLYHLVLELFSHGKQAGSWIWLFTYVYTQGYKAWSYNFTYPHDFMTPSYLSSLLGRRSLFFLFNMTRNIRMHSIRTSFSYPLQHRYTNVTLPINIRHHLFKLPNAWRWLTVSSVRT